MFKTLLVFVAVLGLFSSASAAGTCTVTASALNVRSGPSTSNGKVGLVYRGNTLSWLGSSGSWRQIRLSNGNSGWVSGSYVSCSGSSNPAPAPAPSPSRTVCVTASALNVRSGPSTSNSRVGTVRRGDRLTVTGSSNGWLRISSPSGWVSGQYTGSCSGGSTPPSPPVGGGSLTDLITLPAGIKNAGGSRPQGPNGYTYPSSSFMVGVFGRPCSMNTNCGAITNSALKRHIITHNVGPFRVTGHRYAVNALACALKEVRRDNPTLYNALGTAGMACCRAVRGSSSSYSNHSFGMAIDIKINGRLDPRGDGKAQRGLHQLYPYMHRHGFYWAAGYSGKYEDAMHFEIARQVVTRWQSSPPSLNCL
jgi:uncharacterized protein YraI